MSGQRFTIHKESEYKDEWYAYPFCIKCDGELVLGSIPLHIAEAVSDKLNAFTGKECTAYYLKTLDELQ